MFPTLSIIYMIIFMIRSVVMAYREHVTTATMVGGPCKLLAFKEKSHYQTPSNTHLQALSVKFV